MSDDSDSPVSPDSSSDDGSSSDGSSSGSSDGSSSGSSDGSSSGSSDGSSSGSPDGSSSGSSDGSSSGSPDGSSSGSSDGSSSGSSPPPGSKSSPPSPPPPSSDSNSDSGGSNGSPPSSDGDSSPPSPPKSDSGGSNGSPPSSDGDSSPPSPPKSPPSDASSSPPPKSSPPPPKSSSNSPSPPSNNAPPPPSPSSDDDTSPSSDNNSPPSSDNNSNTPSPPKSENRPPPSPDSQSKDSPSSKESPPSRQSPRSSDSSSDSPPPEKSLPFITNTPSDSSTPSRSSPTHSDSTPSDSTSRLNPPSKNADSSSSRPSSSNGSSSSSSMTGLAVGLAVAGVVVVFVAFIIVISRKKKRRPELATYYIPPNNHSGISEGYYYSQEKPPGSAYPSDQFYPSKPPIPVASANMGGSQRGQGYHSGLMDSGSKASFSYEELGEITNGFSRENLLGEGGFGCVYKGRLQDGREVAVKELKAGSGQGEREFQAEVEIISRVHHRHLVSLVGYCIAGHHRLLVYEFVPNDTLENHLHGKGSVLDWSMRQKIAIGSAKGLAYLHEDCHPRIIHRDIKSANILLDDDWEAQVADFGLAKLSNDTRTHVSTRVMGTFGYMAPEYASSGKLTDRSDVYSFGVVLLELITGRKPVDPTQPMGDESLVEWARPVLVHAIETGDYTQLVDPKLENNYARSEMFRMVEAAAACVRHSAPKRPRMIQVVRALDFDDQTDLSNGVKFGQSQVFDPNQCPADIQKFRNMAFGSSAYSGEYGYSGEQDRRSSANSGEFRSGLQRPPGRVSGELGPPRPPNQQRPGEQYRSGEYQGGGFVPPPPYRPRSGEYSSGEYDSGESETRAIIRGSSGRSDGGGYMYNGRGIP